MRKYARLAALAAVFAAAIPPLASAMPVTPTGPLRAAGAISSVEKAAYGIGYYAPYVYYPPNAHDGPYYSGVPAYSYYDYYQTYGCSFPGQYCVYYAW